MPSAIKHLKECCRSIKTSKSLSERYRAPKNSQFMATLGSLYRCETEITRIQDVPRNQSAFRKKMAAKEFLYDMDHSFANLLQTFFYCLQTAGIFWQGPWNMWRFFGTKRKRQKTTETGQFIKRLQIFFCVEHWIICVSKARIE